MKKIIYVTTVPESMSTFCKGAMRDLAAHYDIVGVSSPGTSLDEVGRIDGVRVLAVPMERHISLIKDGKSLVSIYRILRREKPDMIHSMTPKAGLVSMVAAWLARVPVRVHTFTGLVFPTCRGIKRRILMTTDRITCACATHIIPEGEGVKNDLIKNGITKKPMRVLGYGNVRGVDMDYYSRRNGVLEIMESLRLKDPNLFSFLFVGRVVRDKGVNELVSAFAQLHQKCPETRLLLVGPYEDALDPIEDSTRNSINEGEGIIYAGEKKGEELLAYYAAADCFVLPSYREGFPNTVLEAGAMGLPSIVTDINGSREIIIEGENGMIVPPQDSYALQMAMRRAVEDKESLAIMASNARTMVGDRFEQGFVRKCLYDFYESILEN